MNDKISILNRYKELLKKFKESEENKKYISNVVYADSKRFQKAIESVYAIFYEEIENDLFESVLILAVAYIIEEQI